MLIKVRNEFLRFFESKGHTIVPSYSLLPANDATLLFINSGMAPFKKYFLQEATPPSLRVTDSQYCLRVGGKHNDLCDVGYTKRHHTFFEMLGNFSFGDYFQNEAIEYAWEFLTEILKLDKSRLYITVHPEDIHAFEVWSRRVSEDRITKLEENVWSMGDIGPFGYCSEIFYDLQEGSGDLSCGDRYLEIWNLVFMKYYSDGAVKTILPKPCIDAGMGLERIVSVLEGKTDTYEIAFFHQVLPILEREEHTKDSKIFLDHLRSIAFMISEGVAPGAGKRDYVLRRLIRRALYSFSNLDNLELEHVVRNILGAWQKNYDFIWDIEKIWKILQEEQALFHQTIDNGKAMFEEMFAKSCTFSAEQLFLLHDTYGFSIDIATDLLKTRDGIGDVEGFEKLMEESKERSRKKGGNLLLPFPKTEFVEDTELETNIIGMHADEYIVLDRSIFYAEGGGQVGDVGMLEGPNFKVKILDTKKIGGVYIHAFENVSGSAALGRVIAKVDNIRRRQIRAHHSATHLLGQAICDVLGAHTQQGSYVCEDRLRLDFNHAEAITQEELVRIENLVNEWIQQNYPVRVEEMPFKEAIARGAVAHFTYDEMVRTIKMGPVSFELCGGLHVSATGDIGLFKIVKANSVRAGIKRIEAVCAKSALAKVQKTFAILKDISTFLNIEEEMILQKLETINKKSAPIAVQVEKRVIGNLTVAYCLADDVDIEKCMKENNLDILCVQGANGKMSLQLKILNLPKLDARVVMQELGMLIGARGCGGNKSFAQTGGKDISNQAQIFKKLCEIIEQA